MSRIQVLLACSILCCCAVSLRAQYAPVDPILWSDIAPSPADELPWPGGGFVPTGTFGRTIAGQFSDDGIMDAFVLRGTTAVFVYGPASYRAFHALAGDALDFERLPGCSPHGLDVLARITSTGLQVDWLAPDAAAFTATTGAPLGAQSWLGAKRLRAADWNADGTPDLVALDADLRTLRIKLADPGSLATGLQLADAAGFSTLHDVLDFFPIRYDVAQPLGIAAMTTNGLRIYDHSGNQLYWARNFFPGDALAVFPVMPPTAANPHPRERVAWITRAPNGVNQLLTVVDPSGYEEPLALGPFQAVALAAGDFDGDGYADLAASVQSAHQLAIFFNQTAAAAPTTFTLAGMQLHDLLGEETSSAPAPGNFATPVLADFDGDLDADVLMPVQSTPKLKLVFSGKYDQISFVNAELGPVGYLNESGPSNGTAVEPTGWLQAQLGAPSASIPGATHLEMTVWRQDAVTAAPSPVAVDYERRPLSELEIWPATYLARIVEAQVPQGSVYHVVFRVVRVNASNVVADAGPAMIIGYSTSTTAIHQFADLIGAPDDPIAVTLVVSTGTLEPTLVGGFVPQAHVPDFGAGEIPRPHAP